MPRMGKKGLICKWPMKHTLHLWSTKHDMIWCSVGLLLRLFVCSFVSLTLNTIVTFVFCDHSIYLLFVSITCSFALAHFIQQCQPHNLWFDERRLRLIHYAWNVVLLYTERHSIAYPVAVHTICTQIHNMHLFKSQIGRGIRATTDNFRTNNLLFYFANVSTGSYTLNNTTAHPLSRSLSVILFCVQWK